MGLDMYCRKISKVSEEDVAIGRYDNKMPSDFPNLLVLSEEDVEKDEGLYYDILPYLTKVNMVANRVNYTLLKQCYDIPVDAELYRFGHRPECNELTFRKGEKQYECTLTEQEWNTFVEYAIMPTFIAKEEDVGYWRKEYDLEEALYKEYEAHTSLIHMVLYYLEHTSCVEKWKNACGISEHLEGLDIEETAKILSDAIKSDASFTGTVDETEVKEILEETKEKGVKYMKGCDNNIFNCGYHIMNDTMASLAGKTLEYELLDKKTEVLVYKEWY